MKRLLTILVCTVIAIAAYAQTSTYHTYISEHYRVNSDSSRSEAEGIASKMEAALKLFNETLHFDMSELDTKLKVTIFARKSSFDGYLNKILNETREDFVYIHYSDIAKSELVGFEKTDEDAFDSSLLHQGFIQLFKAFIPNPPIWLREGLATYFDNSIYDNTSKSFTYKPNLLWLDSLKSILGAELSAVPAASAGTAIPIGDFLLLDRESVQEKLQSFYPQAWGIVSFLRDSEDKSYNRLLWDSLSALEAGGTLQENSLLIIQDVAAWADEERITEDFVDYVFAQKTFNDLVAEGIDLYTSADLSAAGANFLKAVALEPTSFIPYYYLGLINYAEKDYLEAEDHYEKALKLGADSALTKYALGVNAFADNQFGAAVAFLTEAKQANPDKYLEKVDSLLQRIETLK